MDAYTLWERNATNTGWEPSMTYETRSEAEASIAAWARDFLDEFGCAPSPGRDYRLTMDLIPGRETSIAEDLRRLIKKSEIYKRV